MADPLLVCLIDSPSARADRSLTDMPIDSYTTESPSSGTVRKLLLAVVLLGMLGLIAELILLEHYESPWQLIPLTAMTLGFLLGLVVWLNPTGGTLRAFRGVMVFFLLAGALGLYLHFDGNIEFELENDPSQSGFALIWEAMRGATPTLAPGALAQLGLLGLIFTYKHPAIQLAKR